MLENNNIKYKTDTIGFFAIMVNIPDKKEIIAIKSRNSIKNPLNVCVTTYISHIDKFKILITWT